MRSKHLFISLCVVVALTIFMAGQTFAGAGEGPADLGSGVICDPAVWAVVVIQTDKIDYKITVRAKQIENCYVQKDAYFLDLSDCGEDQATAVVECPAQENDFINFIFGPKLFDIDNPVITKIKNFHSELDPNDNAYTLISFDAQLKGYHPGGTCPTQ